MREHPPADPTAQLHELDRLLIDEIDGTPFPQTAQTVPALIELAGDCAGELRAGVLELLIMAAFEMELDELFEADGSCPPLDPARHDPADEVQRAFARGASVYAAALCDEAPVSRAWAAHALARSRLGGEELRPPLLAALWLRAGWTRGLDVQALRRSHELVVAVFESLGAAGRRALMSAVEALAPVAERSHIVIPVISVASGLGTMLAVCCTGRGELPSSRYDALLCAAVTGSAAAEPLRSLLAALPPRRREAILAGANGFCWGEERTPLGAWLFWDLGVTGAIVPAIVRNLSSGVSVPYGAPLEPAEPRRALALELLSQAAPDAGPAMEALAADPGCTSRDLFAEAIRRHRIASQAP